MSSFLEIIQQLKTNQKVFNTNLAKIESLGRAVDKSLLRELIQDARELHEDSVILSYILSYEQNQNSQQLEIQLKESLDDIKCRIFNTHIPTFININSLNTNNIRTSFPDFVDKLIMIGAEVYES